MASNPATAAPAAAAALIIAAASAARARQQQQRSRALRDDGPRVVREWYRRAARVYSAASRPTWSEDFCPLAPLQLGCPDVLNLSDMLMGALEGWQRPAVPTPSSAN